MREAYDLFAALTALLFILPLAGGVLGEKLGYRLAIAVGFMTIILGTGLLMVVTKATILIGVACFAAGNALVTPNIYALIGLLYENKSSVRNSAYTFYYLLFNLGFFFSIFFEGFIAADSFHLAFIIGGVSTWLAFLIFILFFNKLVPAKGNTFEPQVNWHLTSRLIILIIFMILLALLSLLFFHHIELNNSVFFVLSIIVSLGLLITALRQKTKVQGRKLIAFLILCIFSVAFWSPYMLEGSLLTVFIAKNVNRVVMGVTIPASSYYSLDSFFVIILGFFFTWLWLYLTQKNKDLSLPAKFVASLFAMGAGYLIFALGIVFANHNTHLVSSLWIILGYALLASGELLISPIALAMIGVLMPKGRDGLGMGIWQTFIGLSGVISGYLANLAVVPTNGAAQNTNPIFMQTLFYLGLGVCLVAIIMSCWIPRIKRLIEGH